MSRLEELLRVAREQLAATVSIRKSLEHPKREENAGATEEGKGEVKRWWGLSSADLIQAFIALVLVFTLFFTGRSYWLASDTAQRQLRAYVYVKEVNIAGSEEESSAKITNVVMENGGLTNARRVSLSDVHLYILPRTQTVPLVNYPVNEHGGAPDLVPPRGLSTATFAIDRAQLQGVREGRSIEHVWGTINYLDVFGNSHFTKFCLSSLVYAPPEGDKGEEFFFGPCSGHNCDDEDCSVADL